jgi:hypothetical protein
LIYYADEYYSEELVWPDFDISKKGLSVEKRSNLCWGGISRDKKRDC